MARRWRTGGAVVMLALAAALLPAAVGAQSGPSRGRASFEAVYAPGAGLRIPSPDGRLTLRVPPDSAPEELIFAYEQPRRRPSAARSRSCAPSAWRRAPRATTAR